MTQTQAEQYGVKPVSDREMRAQKPRVNEKYGDLEWDCYCPRCDTSDVVVGGKNLDVDKLLQYYPVRAGRKSADGPVRWYDSTICAACVAEIRKSADDARKTADAALVRNYQASVAACKAAGTIAPTA